MYYKQIDGDLIYIYSLAKWKREAEAWYRHNTSMLEGLLHTVEENVVRKCRIYKLQHYDDSLFRIDEGRR